MDTYVTASLSPPEKKSKSLTEDFEDVKIEILSPRSLPAKHEKPLLNDTDIGINLKEEEKNEVIVQYVEPSDDNVQVIESIEDLESAIEEILPSSDIAPEKRVTTISFSMQNLTEAIEKKRAASAAEHSSKIFLARINPNDTDTAEAELNRQIDQSDFEKVFVALILL